MNSPHEMVKIDRTKFLSDIRGQTKYQSFPCDEFNKIKDAIDSTEGCVFLEAESGTELRQFDNSIATDLSEYIYEHGCEKGRHPRCKLWSDQGFGHSVDLYHPDKRIAIEIEKSERKRVSDDILKFIKGGKSQHNNRKKIEYGCLIVPTNYRGKDDLFKESIRTLEFIRSILFVKDIAVIGYRDPRW